MSPNYPREKQPSNLQHLQLYYGEKRQPPELTIEPSWPETYAEEAKRYEFDVPTVEEAAELVRAFIAEIDA